MAAIIDWARDVLIGRGALVGTEQRGPARHARRNCGALGSAIGFSCGSAGCDADDESEWLERLGRLASGRA
jgi:hypothetical protein